MKLKTVSAMVAILGIPAVASANDWTELRSDASGTSFSTESSGALFAPSWTYSVQDGGKLVSTPVSVDGAVLVASTNGALASVGLTDGKEKWSRTFDGGIGSTPAVSGGRIAVSTQQAQLFGLRADTGETVWQQDFGGGMNYSSPVVVAADGSFVLPEGFPAQAVHRFAIATGARMWDTGESDIAGLLYTTPAISGDQAIVGMNGGRYQSLDLKTGATRWKYDARGDVYLSSPLVDDETVYMFPGDAGSHLYAVDAATGAPREGFPVAIPDLTPVAGNGMLGNGPAVSSPMKAGGLVIVQLRRQDMVRSAVAMRESVVAIDPRTATVVWQYQLANVTAENANGVPELQACATPAGFESADGALIAVSSSISARVAVLDAATGAERWTAALTSPGRSSPVFSNGQLLVGTDAGVLHAFSSMTNKAPAAPASAVATLDATTGALAVSWNAATDPEGAPVAYRVRAVDAAGATLVADTQAGQTSLALAAKVGATYDVSVRSIDPNGALSAWSPCSMMGAGNVAVAPPPVTTTIPPPTTMAPPVTTTAPPATAPMASCAPPPAAAAGTSPSAPAATGTDTTSAPTTTTTTATTTTTTPSSPVVTILPSTSVPTSAQELTVPQAPTAVTVAAAAPASVVGMIAPSSFLLASAHPLAVAAVAAAPATNATNTAPADDLADHGGCSVGGAGRNPAGASLAGLAMAIVVLSRRSRRLARARR
ncbi:MAG TPA: PQQ-binding-like beta-propeller repeat protein [Polyangia bacterium]|nr:PQQ-binding-like beta-propeller repeat protein [Polyangia bacterium]